VILLGGYTLPAKYLIQATLEIDGIVEKTDVIGALFGQTEGLLGDELDLRELQRMGRIGRIEIKLEKKGANKTSGKIIIPSNLDRVETAVIAAAIETVDKIGPYNARIKIQRIEDTRKEKIKRIIERAKDILLSWGEETETRELLENVMREVRTAEVVKYGEDGLPAGPDIDKADTIIIVEGRADVINLLRHGYRNVIAIGGANISKTIVELSKRKKTILFVDGDRGGELIIKNALAIADIDYIAKAPPGREVEELTGKEIAKALHNKLSVSEYLELTDKDKKAKSDLREAKTTFQIPDVVKKKFGELRGTLEAIIYGDEWKELRHLPVKDLVKTLLDEDLHPMAIVFDGIITQRLVDAASNKNVKIIIGVRKGDIARVPKNMTLLTFEDIA